MADFTNFVSKAYLDGTEFNENVSFTYKFDTPISDRLTILAGLARGKRVLHIGCCDHPPNLRAKLAEHKWLHGRLSEVADECVGIDINAEAVEYAKSISGLKNIYCRDITGRVAIPEISHLMFDSVIFGEVLEHIGNPVNFLGSFVRRYGTNVRRVIITVPSALRGGNVLNIFRNRETINSDHRFFFTPYTLSKVAWDAGLLPLSVQVACYSHAGIAKRFILNKFPLLAEDLVYIGVPRTEAANSEAAHD